MVKYWRRHRWRYPAAGRINGSRYSGAQSPE
jgi:hypothetical protein